MPMGVCSSNPLNSQNYWISSKKINPNQVDLSHFKIVSVIGSGGFAKVFQAVNRLTHEVVAIKVIDKSRAVKSKTFFKSIWAERDIMSKTQNTFLLNLIVSFQTYYECFLVVPFLHGSDFTHYSRSHYFLNENEIKFYFCQLLVAVEYLHDRKIVHRDIKPRNILLDADGNIKLCDFGLAHQFTSDNEYLKSLAGTDSYNAPEMIMKSLYRFTVDIWSMGVSLYEMLYRKRPYGSDKKMIKAYQNKETIQFLESFEYSNQVKSLLKEMLAWETQDRIGCGPGGIAEIKEHVWLKNVDWEKVKSLSLVPPYRPRETKEGTVMVDKNVFETKKKHQESVTVTPDIQKKFKGFEYNVGANAKDPSWVKKKPQKDKRLLKVNLAEVFKDSVNPKQFFD